MNFKDACKEVVEDIKDFGGKLKLGLVVNVVLFAICIVVAVISGLASIIWSWMAIFMETASLVENFTELLLIAWVTFLVSGFFTLVYNKMLK